MYCSKILLKPILLPCDHTLCKEHLYEGHVRKLNQIKCPTCNEAFSIKESNFTSNESIESLLKREAYLNENEKNMKRSVETSFQIQCQLHSEFKSNKVALDLECHEHFQEMRRTIDIHREEMKAKIDQVSLEMIAQTKEFEKFVTSNVNKEMQCVWAKGREEALEKEENDLNEVFRCGDSDNLIDLVKKVQLKQNEAILELKSKLNEMIYFKDDFELNEFKANFSMSKDSFGCLRLNEFSSNDPFKSQILNPLQSHELIKLCEFSPKDKFTLLYRGSVDGFGSNAFHAKCNGHSNTLTILKTKETSNIFGGFTSTAWDSINEWKSDPDSFLFSLVNQDNKPIKMKVDKYETKTAIYCDSLFGPSFGRGTDLCVFDNANKNCQSYSNLSHSFKHPEYAASSNEAMAFLAGTFEFQLNEIEVYKKSCF